MICLDARLVAQTGGTNVVHSGGGKTRVSSAKVLGLVAAALVVIALLLTVPLASLASARVEARAGGAVAIAGGDCDAETDEENNAQEIVTRTTRRSRRAPASRTAIRATPRT